MTRTRRVRILLLGAMALLPASTWAATVKLKTGVVVEGKIEGMLIQSAAKAENLSFTIRRGADITAIDERGVSFKKGSKVLTMSFFARDRSADTIEADIVGGLRATYGHLNRKEDAAGADASELRGGFAGDPGSEAFNRSSIGFGVQNEDTWTAVKDGIKAAAIQVRTPTGLVAIPVKDIVAFSK
jgi:hypothetical protein